MTVMDALIESGLIKSMAEGRRLFRAGAVKLVSETPVDAERVISSKDAENGIVTIRVGKRRILRVPYNHNQV